MPALNEIAQLINTSLSTDFFKGNKFQNAKYFGVVDFIKTIEKDKEIETICVIDDDGEAIRVVYDDTYILQCFHRIDNLSYSIAEPNDYGDPGTTMQEIANIKFILTANRSRIRVQPEQVMAAAVMGFPKEFTPAQITSLLLTNCIIEMGDVNNDPYSVWNDNWPETDFGMKPGNILFSISYKIISNFNKNCFNLCE